MGDWHTQEWETLGRADPYFNVLLTADPRGATLTESGRAAFLESGEQDVRDTLRVLRQLAGPSFQLERVLDFGCGVGRLTIPFARVANHVVGVDAAPAILAEARANCERSGVSNVELSLADASLGGISGPFELVHSYIVFQHIPPTIGYPLVEKILEGVAPRGGGMLHFTYACDASAMRRAVHVARRSSQVVHRLMNLAEHKPLRSPLMAIFEYDVNRLFAMLQARRFDRTAVRFTSHGEHLGAKIFFWRGY